MSSANSPNLATARARSRCWVSRAATKSGSCPSLRSRSCRRITSRSSYAGRPRRIARPSGDPSVRTMPTSTAGILPFPGRGASRDAHRGRDVPGTGTRVDRVLTGDLDLAHWHSPQVSASAPRVRIDPRDGESDPGAQSPSTSTHPTGEEHTVSVSIKPLEDRIVIKSLEAEQTTASGLVIPDTAKEKPQEGEVLAVGPGRIDDKGNRVPLDVQVGDRVIYSKYGGTEIKHGGEEYLILSARDVLAVVG